MDKSTQKKRRAPGAGRPTVLDSKVAKTIVLDAPCIRIIEEYMSDHGLDPSKAFSLTVRAIIGEFGQSKIQRKYIANRY